LVAREGRGQDYAYGRIKTVKQTPWNAQPRLDKIYFLSKSGGRYAARNNDNVAGKYRSIDAAMRRE
jgi:hypothetical protein